MHNTILRHTMQLVLAVLTFTAWQCEALAQNVIDICLKTGVTIRAASLQPSGNGYAVVPIGSNTPMDVPADQVQTIGAACQGGGLAQAPVPAASPATPAATAPATPQASAGPTVNGGARFGIHGSRALGDSLLPALIEAYAQKRGWKATVRGADEANKEIELSAPGASQSLVTIDLKSGGSSDAARALLDGSAAIGMSTRRLTADEAAQFSARFHIDPLTAASNAEHVVALDALAVIVHRDNPLKSLLFDKLERIFSGEITNWKEVEGLDEYGDAITGPDIPIQLHTLDPKSDSYDFFRATALGGREAATIMAKSHISGANLSEAVSKDRGAIGFVEFPDIRQNSALEVGGSCDFTIEPSSFTTKTEQYPLTRRLYLYTAGAPSHPQVRDFLEFALSDEAQKTVLEVGLIDQSVEFQKANEQAMWLTAVYETKFLGLPFTQQAPKATKAKQKPDANTALMAAGYEALKTTMLGLARTSIVFRFERNSFNLDARALQDVRRLGHFMKEKGTHAGVSQLAGFADLDGPFMHNAKLSQLRAERVKSELQKQGLLPKEREDLLTPTGFSYLAPVACNNTEIGKTNNRRVEFWALDLSKTE